jgi:hypothetical protein
LIALSNVGMVGLHSDWWAKRMLLAFVLTVCVKKAICRGRWVWASVTPRAADGSLKGGREVVLVVPNGSVQRSVTGSLAPRKIILLLYRTIHSVVVNVTLQPASVRTRIPNREAIERSGMMWPVRIVGSPSITISHMCVDVTIRPSARATFNGRVVGRRLLTGVPSMTKTWVAPESAMDIAGGSCTIPPAMSRSMSP